MDQRCLAGGGVTNAARPPVGHRRFVPAPAAASRCNRLAARVAAPSAPLEAQTQLADQAAPTARVPVCNDLNQHVREGHYEASLVQAQAMKADDTQQPLASVLPRPDTSKVYDVAVVGAGPAGMYLANELARRGLSTVVIGRDLPLVNNYGVWTDEFKALGLDHTLERSWDDAVCWFGEGRPVRLGRGYGRVSRRKLREHLAKICSDSGVAFLPGEVTALDVPQQGGAAGSSAAAPSRISATDGTQLQARLVTLASGAAAGKFLQYEENAPSVAVQTAYGIEAEVEGYEGAYPADEMLFMDFRRHHTGVWDGSAARITQVGAHPNAGDGEWGTSGEVPSFLYAMPLGGNRVFLEETCLVAKPALPFAVLKRRLERRLKAVGMKVTSIHEEEWSYIPVGGPLPVPDQPVAAFGAAANLVHPATGFSVSRSFREAPLVADEIASALKQGLPSHQVATRVWNTLWPQEKRTQTSFHVFGMELLATLDLASTNAFFDTFFKLPSWMWRGYMASKLTSSELIGFALLTFVLADPGIKYKLIHHLVTDPSGGYLVSGYAKLLGLTENQDPSQQQQGELPTPQSQVA